ncbi:MAG: hypothetical protein JXR50_05755 [Prolixibacteraceae bacterium]|nr:hypothetical protein [Prolixibacteraceae bacterium]
MNKAVESFFFSLLLKIKKMKRITILILLFLAISCCNDDSNTYYFTDIEKELFYYTEGSNFKLLVLPDQDTMSCEVTLEDTYHESTTYYMHRCPSQVHVRKVEIQTDIDLYFEIEYVKSLEGFSFYIGVKDESPYWRSFIIETEEKIDKNFSIVINGKRYENLVALDMGGAIDDIDTLYFSPDYGIVKFTNSDTKKSYYLIE